MRIAVGMSGGVDSTVTACLLKQQGHEVIGLTMQIWDGSISLPDEGRSGCFGPGEARELEEARRLAAVIGIPHHTIPLAAEYREFVLEYFRREYLAGRTPNPCVACNQNVKFGFLLERARQLGVAFDAFATGHYAQVEKDEATGRFLLRRGVDASKDQSYFLSHLRQAQLAQVMFPLGGMMKTQVKQLARDFALPDVAGRAESQDFIETNDYGVLFSQGEVKPGPIVDTQGKVLGEHRGIIHYTIGQRKGLGIGGAAEPYYVVRIDGGSNTVVVGPSVGLFSRELTACRVNWILGNGSAEVAAFVQARAPEARVPEGLRVRARIRQQHREAAAMLRLDHAESDPVSLLFDEPQMSITPGQIVVFYHDDLVLGGGTIA